MSSSYRSYKSSGQFVGWAAECDTTQSQTTSFDTMTQVTAGDLIIVFQWLTTNDNSGGTIPPTDNFGSTYKELTGADKYLGGSFVCGGVNISVGLGGVYYAIAAGSGDLVVNFGWTNPPDDVPCYVVYVFSGVRPGDILYNYVSGQTTTSNSVSVTTNGLSRTACHYALIVAYVGSNPCYYASPNFIVTVFNQATGGTDTCKQVCSSPVITLTDSIFFGYYNSQTDFTFQLQFTNKNTTQYGYFIVLV